MLLKFAQTQKKGYEKTSLMKIVKADNDEGFAVMLINTLFDLILDFFALYDMLNLIKGVMF